MPSTHTMLHRTPTDPDSWRIEKPAASVVQMRGIGSGMASMHRYTGSSTTPLAGLFGGILVWIVAFPATLVGAGGRIDALAPVIAGLSATMLSGFGVVFLADTIEFLL